MHRLTATDTPMVRYTRTIFPPYANKLRPLTDTILDHIKKSSYKISKGKFFQEEHSKIE